MQGRRHVAREGTAGAVPESLLQGGQGETELAGHPAGVPCMGVGGAYLEELEAQPASELVARELDAGQVRGATDLDHPVAPGC